MRADSIVAATRKPRKRNPRDAQESRRRLVEAAAQIFNTVGFHGTDTNRIAKAAGYTPGTFYTHFPDKRAIFLEVYETWVDAELNDLTSGFRLKGANHRDRLARTLLEHHRKWKVFRASLRALYVIDPEIRKTRLTQMSRQVDTIAAIAKEAGREPQSRANLLGNLLLVGAICDAIADGNLQILGVKESEMFDILKENVGRRRSAIR